MTKQQRRPGDQAPAGNRPAHRNDHIRTATTHVKDTAGKVYCVHDGNEVVITLDGKLLIGLSYDEARKAKDACVTRLKQRRATIREMAPEHSEVDDLDINVRVDGTMPANVPAAPDAFMAAAAALPDPQLEQARQKAVAAVKPVAQQAQARASAVVRAPGWEPAPPRAQATGKAAGWEAPPEGVSGARRAAPDNKQQGQAAGWVKADADAPKPAVSLDAPDGEEGTDDLSDLMITTDLESDVKVETERAQAAAKKLWDGLGESVRQQIKAQVIRAAEPTERETMFAAMDPGQVAVFESYETAYHLLFGLPPVPQTTEQTSS